MVQRAAGAAVGRRSLTTEARAKQRSRADITPSRRRLPGSLVDKASAPFAPLACPRPRRADGTSNGSDQPMRDRFSRHCPAAFVCLSAFHARIQLRLPTTASSNGRCWLTPVSSTASYCLRFCRYTVQRCSGRGDASSGDTLHALTYIRPPLSAVIFALRADHQGTPTPLQGARLTALGKPPRQNLPGSTHQPPRPIAPFGEGSRDPEVPRFTAY